MKKFIILSLSFYSCFSFGATLSPYDLSVLAEERAPLIKAQIENKAVSESQISQSKLLPNPILTLQSGSIKSATQSGSVIDVTIGQPLPWPGRRDAQIDGARILGKVASMDVDQSRLVINHAATLLGIEWAILNELEKHNKERRQRISIINKALASRPLASPKQVVEKNLITNQLRLVKKQMYENETKKASVRQQLKNLTDLDQTEVVVNWSSITAPAPFETFSQDLEKGHAYRRSMTEKELALNRVEQARYLARPDIVVGLNYRRENVAPINHFYHANVAISIPIIDHGQNTVEIARAEVRREEAGLKHAKVNGHTQMAKSYQLLVSAYKSTELFRISDLKQMEKDFKSAEDAFQKGRIDATTFLQTDLQIHETVDTAFMSFANYYSALSEIYLLTGKRLEVR